MRWSDVRCEQQLPADHRTERMYMPAKTAYAEMDNSQLRRGLCAKSGGSWEACKSCPGGCQAGRLLVDRMEGRVPEPEKPAKEWKDPIQLVKKETAPPSSHTKAGNPRVEAAMLRRAEKAMQRYLRTLQRMAAGATLAEAARAEGYYDKRAVTNFRQKHKEACEAARLAAGIPDLIPHRGRPRR